MARISSSAKVDQRKDIAALDWEHLEAMSAAQLVELHNSVVDEDKRTKRFSDKKTAMRRTWQAVCRHKAWLAEHRREAQAAAAEKAEDGNLDERAKRSVAAASSWNDAAVRTARSSRIKVLAAGQEYDSVGRAFKDLQLTPYSAHIAFRARLRDQGKAAFTSRDGRVVEFKLQAVIPPVGQRGEA